MIDNKQNSCNGKEVSAFLGVIDTYKRWKHYSQRGDRKYDYYHPSELGKCLRAQQYKHYADKGEIELSYQGLDSRTLRLFDKGHNMHDRWAGYFEEIGVLKGRWKCRNAACLLYDKNAELINLSKEKKNEILAKDETRIYGSKAKKGIFKPDKCACGSTYFDYLETTVFSEELKIKGHSDLILDYSNFDFEKFNPITPSFNTKFLPKNGDEVVVDMKTIGQSSWEYQVLKKGAHPSYLVQLVSYIHILDCSYGLLVYENKNDSDLRCFKVERNDAWWEAIKWQAKKLQELATGGKLPPPRPSKKSDYECKNCDFSQLCHKSGIWKDPKLDIKRKNFYKGLL